MKLGFVSAILPDLSLQQVVEFAAAEDYSCVEVMCWPVSKADRRYAGVTHVDVTDFGQSQEMCDVFVSCARTDLEVTVNLAAEMSGRGLSVWFYGHLIPGDPFGRIIEAKLREAAVVVVLWSECSVVKDWVYDEADLAGIASSLRVVL